MKLSTTLLTMVFAACGMMPCAAFELKSDHADKDIIISIADDTLHVTPLSDNAARIRFCKKKRLDLPEWVYIAGNSDIPIDVTDNSSAIVIKLPRLTIDIDKATGLIAYSDADESRLVKEINRQLTDTRIAETVDLFGVCDR